MTRIRPSLERIAVAVVVSAAAALVSLVGLRALGLPWPVAAALALFLGGGGAWWLARQLPSQLDGQGARRPGLCALWMLLAVLALVQTARVSAFMVDPTRTQHSLMPWDQWMTQHSCLTSYTEAARFTRAGKSNIFDPNLYSNPIRFLGHFQVDLYHYPPPFLVIPLAMQAALGTDYPPIRAAWFALCALAFMLALGLLAQRLPPDGQLRAIFVAPALWASVPAQMALQMTNVQILVLSVAMIAMVVMARSRALGGALLALAIVSKLFPGILLVYLAVQRRWRDLLWTAGFIVAFILLALAVVGTEPFAAFLGYELPRLSSGEAFQRPFSRLFAVARNMAPFGVPLKLAALGVPGMGLGVGRIVSMIFGLLVLALAIRAGRGRPRSSAEAAAVWIALLGLAGLGSPFAPANYVLLAVLWLLFMHPGLGRPGPVIAVWLLLGLPLLLVPRMHPSAWLQVLAFLPAQILAVAIPALILWRAGLQPATERQPQPAVLAAA